ncbi:MAG: HAD-IIB family hydrolase [Lysobacterales bacterium]
MELIVFDLDGTLLNAASAISRYTADTLDLLTQNGVAYTVATGRTLHASEQVLTGQGFALPQVYKNGAVIWNPGVQEFSHQKMLTLAEIEQAMTACSNHNVTPFVFTIEGRASHNVYCGPLQSDAEEQLKRVFLLGRGYAVKPLSELPAEADIINISAIGAQSAIEPIKQVVERQPKLLAFSGPAFEGQGLFWIDIHRSDASKGAAIQVLREALGITRVICFGDSDNDLSLFEIADERYAPDNALAEVRANADEVIGHHDDDGVARFLRDRFKLNASLVRSTGSQA